MYRSILYTIVFIQKASRHFCNKIMNFHRNKHLIWTIVEIGVYIYLHCNSPHLIFFALKYSRRITFTLQLYIAKIKLLLKFIG